MRKFFNSQTGYSTVPSNLTLRVSLFKTYMHQSATHIDSHSKHYLNIKCQYIRYKNFVLINNLRS